MTEVPFPPDKIIFSRLEIYDLVWRFDILTLAGWFGWSDNNLHKLCRAWHIPKPLVGEWQKIAAGKPVERPGLSKHADVPEDGIVIRKQGDIYRGSSPRKLRGP